MWSNANTIRHNFTATIFSNSDRRKQWRKGRELIEGYALKMSVNIYAKIRILQYVCVARIAAATKPPLWIGYGYQNAEHVCIYCKNIVINKKATTITTIDICIYISGRTSNERTNKRMSDRMNEICNFSS